MGTPKSLEVRKIVLDSHLNGNSTKKILEIKGGSVAKRTVNKWIQEYRNDGKIKPSVSTGRPSTANNHINKKKVKRLLESSTFRQVSKKLHLSLGSITNIRKDLKLKVNTHLIFFSMFFILLVFDLQAYKKRKIPLLKPDHIKKRLRFAQWWRKNKKTEFQKYPFMFSDEKIFTVDGGLNKQNHRVYAYSRIEADQKGGKILKNKF